VFNMRHVELHRHSQLQHIIPQSASLIKVRCMCTACGDAGVALAHGTDMFLWGVARPQEFTSERRRMSMVVRPAGSSRLLLLSKGADSALLPRLAGGCGDG
jgi:magnesium-transporting ATPase (P-type)